MAAKCPKSCGICSDTTTPAPTLAKSTSISPETATVTILPSTTVHLDGKINEQNIHAKNASSTSDIMVAILVAVVLLALFLAIAYILYRQKHKNDKKKKKLEELENPVPFDETNGVVFGVLPKFTVSTSDGIEGAMLSHEAPKPHAHLQSQLQTFTATQRVSAMDSDEERNSVWDTMYENMAKLGRRSETNNNMDFIISQMKMESSSDLALPQQTDDFQNQFQ